MYKNHSIYKRLIFLVLMVVLSCANIGFSSFQYIADNDSASIDESFSEQDDQKIATIIPYVTDSIDYTNIFLNPNTGVETTEKETIDITNETNLAKFRNVINQYKTNSDFDNFMNFDNLDPPRLGNLDSTPIDPGIYSSPSNRDDYSLIIEVHSSIICHAEKSFWGDISKTYEGSASIYLQQSFTKFKSISHFTISFNSEISLTTLKNVLLEQLKINNADIEYSIIGFYENFADNIFSNVISDDFLLTSNSTLYAALYSPFIGETAKSLITSTINNAKSGSLTFYANNTLDSTYNILSDFTYNQETNSFLLGYSNNQTTISNGVTVNFALNDGYIENFDQIPSNAVTYANPDTVTGAKQYTIKLINDLYIYGTLNLYARVGNNSSLSMQSSINGGYVNLDLNGHNIYVCSTGVFNSYGIIEDSIGGGVVNVLAGGQFSSLVTIEDYKGGDSTTSLVREKVFPFTNYFFPYLRCQVFIECKKDSNQGISTGILNGIVYLKLLSEAASIDVPLVPLTLQFVGTNDNSFFKINNIRNNGDVTSGVHLDFNFNDNSNFEEFTMDSNEYRYLTTIRNKWTFKNLDISLNKITMDIKGSFQKVLTGVLAFLVDIVLAMLGDLSVINTDEYTFPLPSYFDLNFINSIFRFSQPVQILPGASLYFDENCFVYLEYNTSRSAGLYSSGDAYNIFKNGSFINNRKVTTSTSENDLSSAALFDTESIWKYSNQPSINCLGTIVFTKGNTVSPYVLVGNINFNKVAICDSNGSNLQELEVDKSQLFSTLQTNGVNVKTYSYFSYPGKEDMVAKAYTLPLISYNNAYVYNSDGTYNLYGSYNQDNGIFTDSKGLNYFFLNDQTFNLTNTSTTLAQLESFDSTQNFITYKGSNYVYFGGCYWLATTISGNSATVNINKANNKSTTANVTYDTTNNLWKK